MKKILLLILTVCMLFTSKPILANESISSTTTIQPYSEMMIENDLTNNTKSIPGAVKKFVTFVIENVAWDILTEVVGYLWSYEPDYKVVEDWAKANGYDHLEFEVLSKEVVYDNGCWKPEFPANPFCKALLKNEEE